MKKAMWAAAVIFLAAVLFTVPAAAQEDDSYEKQYEASGAGELYDSLSDEAKEFFSSIGADPSDPNWIDSLTAQNVFQNIFAFLSGGMKAPLRAAAAAAAILLLSAAAASIAQEGTTADKTVHSVCMLGICLTIILPVCGLIGSVVSAIKGSAVFMMSFVPIYAGILTVSGQTAVAASSGSLLLGGAEAVSSFASFGLTPLVSAGLALSVASSVSPLSGAADAAAYLKKVSVWALSAAATVFTGILSIQTVIGAASDNLKLKTAKLFTSSIVPVVGAALGESLSTVASCFTVLKTSVGIFGILALAVLVLPVLLEILLWRISIMLLSLLCSFLGFGRVGEAIKAADSALSFLAAVMLLVSALFIISLTVVVMAGGKL